MVTLSTYATNQQAAAVSLARRLLPSNAPLGAAPLGAGKPWRVFLTEATASTRGKRASVFAGHVLMVSAAETGSGTGIATAAAYPADAFIKYEFRLRQASCPKCATLAVQSKDPTAALTGLAPSSKWVGAGWGGWGGVQQHMTRVCCFCCWTLQGVCGLLAGTVAPTGRHSVV